MHPALALLIFVGAVAAAAAVGGLAAADSGDQYAELDRPAWSPPAWLFGPVWTILYAAIAAAGFLVWRRAGMKDPAIIAWMVQIAMNALWTVLFFAWQLRGVALAWIIALDVVVAITIMLSWKHSRAASWLLAPYMVWILFATALNAAVWWMNR